MNSKSHKKKIARRALTKVRTKSPARSTSTKVSSTGSNHINTWTQNPTKNKNRKRTDRGQNKIIGKKHQHKSLIY
jgi:hypothetical protein